MTSFADVVAAVINILNSVIYVLIALAVVIFLWGMVGYVRKAASAKKPDRMVVLWSLLTLFVLVSIWGILSVMCASFGNICVTSSSSSPTNIMPAGGAYNYSGPTNGNPGGTAGNLNPIY